MYIRTTQRKNQDGSVVQYYQLAHNLWDPDTRQAKATDATLSVHDAACAYQSMMVIEQCFRSLKRTQIQLGPMFHRLPKRIEAHVKICVLALLIQRVAERATNQSWAPLREVLNTLRR